MTNSVKEVKKDAFSYCSNLKTVYFAGSQKDWLTMAIDTTNTYLLNANVIYTTPKPVTGIRLNKTALELSPGDVEKLTASFTPADATNTTAVWTSSNESVATVYRGTVTAVGDGTAVITATSNDGGKTASCTVTVVTKVMPLTSTTVKQLNSTYKFSIHSERGLDANDIISVVVFDKNGVLRIRNFSRGFDGDTDGDISVPITSGVSYAKVFVWDKDMRPQGIVETVPMQGI